MNQAKLMLASVAVLALVETLVCSAQPVFAQEASETMCNSVGQDIANARAISVDPRGNTYITGGKMLNDHAEGKSLGSAMETVKYDGVGRRLWSRSYQGVFGCFDNGSQIATDAVGNVYVAGLEFLRGDDRGDDDDTSPLAQDLIGTSSENPFEGKAQRAYVVVKYDRDGNRKWVSRFFEEGDNSNLAKGLVTDNRGDVYVTGTSVGWRNDAEYQEIATVKYDGRTGEELWVVRYAGALNNAAAASSAASFDAMNLNLYVAGTVCTRQTESGLCNDFAYVVLKYDAEGNMQWDVQYQKAPTYASFAHAIAVDSAGHVYVTGRGCDSPYKVVQFGDFTDLILAWCDKSDSATIKLNRNGDTIAIARYHGEGEGEASDGKYEFGSVAIAVDNRGGFYVTGAGSFSETPVGLETVAFDEAVEFHTVKFDKEGKQVWASRFNPESYWARGVSIVVDSYGQTYIAGMAVDRFNFGNFTVVAYDVFGNERWSHQSQGSAPTDWEAAAVALGKRGEVRATGGALYGLNVGEVIESSSITKAFSGNGDLLWTDER